MFVSGSFAYVADYDSGLRIIDISDPSNPQEVGFYDTQGRAWDVWVVDTLAYVADYQYGVRVINVAELSSPSEVGFFDTADASVGLFLSGNFLYVADYRSVRVLNVEDSTNITQVGYYYVPHVAWNVFVKVAEVYTATIYSGLQIYLNSLVGVEESRGREDFVVSLKSVFNPVLEVHEPGYYQIEVFNVSGSKIFEERVFLSGPRFTLDAPLRRRVYFVKVTSNQRCYTAKFIG